MTAAFDELDFEYATSIAEKERRGRVCVAGREARDGPRRRYGTWVVAHDGTARIGGAASVRGARCDERNADRDERDEESEPRSHGCMSISDHAAARSFTTRDITLSNCSSAATRFCSGGAFGK